MKNPARLYAALVFLTIFAACSMPPAADAWREANRRPLETGSDAWWDRTKAGW